MDLAVIFWTLFFFGGVALTLVLLLWKALQIDRAEAHGETRREREDRG